MPHKYTAEQKEFIREMSLGRYNHEITELFNKKFGTDLKESQIKSFKANHKIKSDVPRRRKDDNNGLFTKEQQNFIKENAKGLLNLELADLVNEKFNLSVTDKQVKAWKNRRKISSGLKGSEGKAPPNKGKRYPGKTNRTSFKKGQKAHNYKPVGYERVDDEGYVLIKVSDDGPWHKRWRHKHKVIWEQKNGLIPPGCKLLFADGDQKNISLDNLLLISDRQLLTLNRLNLIKSDVDLTKTGIIIADLYNKTFERSKSNAKG